MTADINFDFQTSREVREELGKALEIAQANARAIDSCASNLETAWTTDESGNFVEYLRSLGSRYGAIASGIQKTIDALIKTEDTYEQMIAAANDEAMRKHAEASAKAAEENSNYGRMKKMMDEYYGQDNDLRDHSYVH